MKGSIGLAMIEAVEAAELTAPGKSERQEAPHDWIYRIAIKALVNYQRRLHRQHVSLSDAITVVDPSNQHFDYDVIIWMSISQFVYTLTKDQQEELFKRFHENFTTAQIAMLLQRSENAVRSLQYRALRTLQQEMAREEELIESRGANFLNRTN